MAKVVTVSFNNSGSVSKCAGHCVVGLYECGRDIWVLRALKLPRIDCLYMVQDAQHCVRVSHVRRSRNTPISAPPTGVMESMIIGCCTALPQQAWDGQRRCSTLTLSMKHMTLQCLSHRQKHSVDYVVYLHEAVRVRL